MRCSRSFLAASTISSVFASVVWAEDVQLSQVTTAASGAPAKSQGAELGEIIVTAQKRSESLERVPIAIDALQSSQIRDRQIDSVEDLAASLPGVKFAEFSGAGNVYIRGVGTTLVSGNGESSIAAHVDGIYIAEAQATTMIQDDLARIEVLRGPQSTLYGRNSTGGVINYISADPTSDMTGAVSTLFGNYDRKQVEGDVSGPLSDSVRVRLFGKYQDYDGWTQNIISGQRLDGLKQDAGRLSLDADVTSNWTTKLRVTTDDEDFPGPVFGAYYPGLGFPGMVVNPREVSSPDIYDSYKKITVTSLRNEWRFDNVTLTSLTGYIDFRFNAGYDGIPAVTPVSIKSDSTSKDVSQEFNLTTSIEKFDVIGGLYYYESSKATSSLTDYGLLFPLPDNLVTQGSSQHSASAFTDSTYHVSDTVRLYGGMRVSVERLEQTITSPGRCTLDTERYKNTGLSGRFGGQVDATDRLMFYGQYSHGYKPGGFASSECDDGYVDETINALEFGAKQRLADGRGAINAAIYYYDYKNLQLEQIVVGGAATVNAPKARIFGAEVSSTVRVVNNLNFDLSAAYINSEYKSFISYDNSLGVPGTSLAGFPLNDAPKYSATAAFENRFDVAPLTNVVVRPEVVYSSQYFVREVNEPYTSQSAYVMVNAFAILNLDNGRYSIRLFGKNLTNKTLLESAIGFIGVPLGSFGPPRTYGVELAARF